MVGKARYLINRKTLLETPRFTVVEDNTRNHSGRRYTYTYLRKPSGIGIIAIWNSSIVLVEQYRHVVGKRILELPGGRLERGEDPKSAAMRELREEIGFQAKHLHFLMALYPLPSITNEQVFVYYADSLEECNTAREISEKDMVLRIIPLENLANLLSSNEIPSAVDALSLYVFLHLKHPSLLAQQHKVVSDDKKE